jgi:hypothetical protein
VTRIQLRPDSDALLLFGRLRTQPLLLFQQNSQKADLSSVGRRLTMVRVWYTPPPFGPATDLHTTPYGCKEGVSANWVVKLSKLPKPIGVGVPVLISCMICYLPFRSYVKCFCRPLTRPRIVPFFAVNQKLPFTFDPEYLAARRAYMRYHNMNPIFGISSK